MPVLHGNDLHECKCMFNVKDHELHHVELVRDNRFVCYTCNTSFRFVQQGVARRRKLMRR